MISNDSFINTFQVVLQGASTNTIIFYDWIQPIKLLK